MRKPRWVWPVFGGGMGVVAGYLDGHSWGSHFWFGIGVWLAVVVVDDVLHRPRS